METPGKHAVLKHRFFNRSIKKASVEGAAGMKNTPDAAFVR